MRSEVKGRSAIGASEMGSTARKLKRRILPPPRVEFADIAEQIPQRIVMKRHHERIIDDVMYVC
jgi:hypothetical protein